MSDEQITEPLRDKIAQVLREHVPFEHDWGVDGDCVCGFVTPKWDEFAAYSDHVADVVIEALGLTEEACKYEAFKTEADFGGEGNMSWGSQTVRSLGWRTESRFVTPWEERVMPVMGGEQ